ncbi:MAG: PTS sugar transporter subunit IIB [Elusimicrobia bacterium]|nr:PTS sugar transporter subunit IIB [Elusimicrobiota bacterium]
MPVVFVRIDDRLVHGQVVQGWIPFLKADEVAVITPLAQDETAQALMRMSLPESISLKIMDIDSAVQYLNKADTNPKRILVLLANPQSARELMEKGAKISAINVGGLHYSEGKVLVGKEMFLNEADKASLKKISQLGAKLEGRDVPTGKPADIIKILSGAK